MNIEPKKDHYLINGERYAKVTSVIDMFPDWGLVYWFKKTPYEEIKRIQDQAKNTGSDVHAMCATILQTGLTEAMKSIPYSPILMGVDEWIKENKVKLIKSEEYAVSTEHKYAGRFDALVEVNGKIALLDFKTSSGTKPYPNHWMQICAYEKAVEEKVEELWILILSKEENKLLPYSLPRDQWDNYFQMFYHLLEFYKLKNKK